MPATLLPESKGTATDCNSRRTAIAASTHSAVSPSDNAHDAAPSVRPDQFAAIYDEQCEICQAFVSWLKLLDRDGKVAAVPIVPEWLAAIHPSLELDACLRELHVVTPQGDVRRGWDAVAELARLFPATFLIGWLGIVPPFNWLGRAAYRFVARNRYAVSKCRGGACRVACPDEVKRKSFFGTFWSCYLIGLLIRLPLIAGAGLYELPRVSDDRGHLSLDRKSTRLNSSHERRSRMPSSA